MKIGGNKMTNIKNQDCIEYLKSLPSESVDFVLTDPPYNIGVDGGKGWDSKKGDIWGPDENLSYLQWCKVWTDECVRVLKPNRMLVVWGTLKTDDFLKYKLDVLNSYPDMVGQQEIIWSYNWGGRTKANFARKHEYAWCYSKGDNFLFNADDVRVERKVKKDLRTGKEHTKGTIPTCVWEKNNHTTSKDFCGWHPTTKNIDILKRLIAAYTNKGDTVLDIFMGSGSTAIASDSLGRKVIGCEKSEEYYPQMISRIDQMRARKKENKEEHEFYPTPCLPCI
jgi:site-specific DNA-methyltransferase (adenine-specific)